MQSTLNKSIVWYGRETWWIVKAYIRSTQDRFTLLYSPSFTLCLPLSLSHSHLPHLSLSLLLTHTGISGKSQVLFALVFTTRYLDIFTNFVSVYNSVMKVIFIVTAYGTLYLMFVKFKATYDSNHDTFRAEFLVIPAVGLAMLVNHEFSAMEVSMERK